MDNYSDESFDNISDTTTDTITNIDEEYNSSILGDEDEQSFYESYDINNNITQNILSKYERTQILIERITHLSSGAKPYIKGNFKDNYDIALEELKQKKLPYIIKRTNGGKIDYWKLEDLILNT
tara:strand:+ start:926 stop:1297 length:372 start_codon:yes stop_codon:yes gene_type:complete